MSKYTKTLLLVGSIAVAGCSQQTAGPAGHASSTPSIFSDALSVKGYYDDNEARAKALSKCTVSNDAEYQINMKKPMCANAMQAEMDHELGKRPE